MRKNFKIRKDILIIEGIWWWTYSEKNKYYLMANDYKMAKFEDEHSCIIFERDFINKGEYEMIQKDESMESSKQVNNEINNLTVSMDMLEKQISVLSERTQCIRVEKLEVEREGSEEKEVELCSLAETIRKINYTIKEAKKNLTIIISELEI